MPNKKKTVTSIRQQIALYRGEKENEKRFPEGILEDLCWAYNKTLAHEVTFLCSIFWHHPQLNGNLTSKIECSLFELRSLCHIHRTALPLNGFENPLKVVKSSYYYYPHRAPVLCLRSARHTQKREIWIMKNPVMKRNMGRIHVLSHKKSSQDDVPFGTILAL